VRRATVREAASACDDGAMIEELREDFTARERAVLARHVTNLDQPVFGLVDLPETVKAALFARYSRYPGTLRRLFLEEFAAELPGEALSAPGAAPDQAAEGSPDPAEAPGQRAAELFERVFVGYGDDSVAQLAGAHVACEWSSNILTKILQRPRVGAYLEQSTRYIAFDRALPGGGYRYYRDAELGPGYRAAMDRIFAIYAQAIEPVSAWVAERFPASGAESGAAHARAVRAKALDLLRGLLPAASLSHVGIFASGQAYEQLIMHLAAHPLPEARRCGTLMLAAVSAVMPSFVARVTRPERGGAWIEQLRARGAAAVDVAARLNLDEVEPVAGPSVRLIEVHGDETALLAALLFEACGGGEEQLRARVGALPAAERNRLIGELVGVRANRRHRPGRGFEALRYRFEIVSDYGAFRDLQRHRMLTIQWQGLTADLGAEIPEEVIAAGQGDAYAQALELSRGTWAELRERGAGAAAAYALCLAFRVRYVIELDAREAMHVIELRAGAEGHPSYRAIAHELHRLIGEVHPAVAAAMSHVEASEEPRLERLLAELRGEPAGRAQERWGSAA
jgi:thymidylate synthase ThyX